MNLGDTNSSILSTASGPKSAALFPNARSFVRVRGFTPIEANTCPPESPVPRGTLIRNLRDGTVTVLDPQFRFKPKRNSTFPLGNDQTLWSFLESDDVAADGPIHDQRAVYDATIRPMIPSIVEGYNAAFMIMGANDSGRMYTAYGSPQPAMSASLADTTASNNGVAGSTVSPREASDGRSSKPTVASLGSESTGVFFLFCHDIFKAFEQAHQENSSQLTVEIEVIEIVNEQYNDLLGPQAAAASQQSLAQSSSGAGGASPSTNHRSASTSALTRSGSVVNRPTSSFASGATRGEVPGTASSLSAAAASQSSDNSEPIRVILDPIEGPRLTSVTRACVHSAEQLEQVVRTAIRPLRRLNGRKNTHIVHLRFTETYQFTTAELQLQQQQQQQGSNSNSLSKSRRINVVFAVIMAPPPSFTRCLDVAIERDASEKPSSVVVPYRDSAFTKLYAEIFTQGFHLTMIHCVSPYFEHVKDAMITIPLALRCRKIKCNPRLNHDENLMELRKLADEVRGLKTEVIRQTESMSVVQQELNRRELEILNKEKILAGHQQALDDCRFQRGLLETGREVQRMRCDRAQLKAMSEVASLETELSQKHVALRRVIEERLKTESQSTAVRAKAKELEDKRKEHEAMTVPLRQRITSRREQEAAYAQLLKEIDDIPEAQKLEVVMAVQKRQQLAAEVAAAEQEKKDSRIALGDAKIHVDELRGPYNEVLQGERKRAQLEEAKAQAAQLEAEIAALEEECRRLQLEINNAPSTKCCTVM